MLEETYTVYYLLNGIKHTNSEAYISIALLAHCEVR